MGNHGHGEMESWWQGRIWNRQVCAGAPRTLPERATTVQKTRPDRKRKTVVLRRVGIQLSPAFCNTLVAHAPTALISYRFIFDRLGPRPWGGQLVSYQPYDPNFPYGQVNPPSAPAYPPGDSGYQPSAPAYPPSAPTYQASQELSHYPAAPYQPWAPTRPTHPQSTLVLILGITGLTCLGILAPFAWGIGTKAIKQCDEGHFTASNQLKAGRVLGIVGTVFWVFSVVISITTSAFA